MLVLAVAVPTAAAAVQRAKEVPRAMVAAAAATAAAVAAVALALLQPLAEPAALVALAEQPSLGEVILLAAVAASFQLSPKCPFAPLLAWDPAFSLVALAVQQLLSGVLAFAQGALVALVASTQAALVELRRLARLPPVALVASVALAR